MPEDGKTLSVHVADAVAAIARAEAALRAGEPRRAQAYAGLAQANAMLAVYDELWRTR
jgi:hypothetical protein